jgi:hypothetical protein
MILIQLFLVEKFLIMLIRSKGDQKNNKLRFKSMHVYPFRPRFIFLYDTRHVFYFSSYKYF